MRYASNTAYHMPSTGRRRLITTPRPRLYHNKNAKTVERHYGRDINRDAAHRLAADASPCSRSRQRDYYARYIYVMKRHHAVIGESVTAAFITRAKPLISKMPAVRLLVVDTTAT